MQVASKQIGAPGPCSRLHAPPALAAPAAATGCSRCSPGFYSYKGSLKPCKKCPDGRTTADDPQLQQYITHCNVEPGWGVVAANPVNGDIFNATLPVLDEMALVSLDVLQCPTGYYGGGQSLGATCTKCPEGSTTKDPGSTTVQDCNGEGVHLLSMPVPGLDAQSGSCAAGARVGILAADRDCWQPAP